QSAAQIEGFLVGRFGRSILLRPPATGGIGLVWLVPLATGATAVVALGVFFWRRRRLTPVVVTDEDRLLVEKALSEHTVSEHAAGR
ncbi:MAG: cytochrome c-type biogenesis protein CcmH, partial [Acidimicrobiales bacterium]